MHLSDLSQRVSTIQGQLSSLEQKVEKEEVKGALQSETLQTIQETITQLNETLSSQQKALATLDSVYDSEISAKQAILSKKITFFSRTSVKELKKEIATLQEGKKEVQSQLETVGKTQRQAETLSTKVRQVSTSSEERLLQNLKGASDTRELQLIRDASQDPKTQEIIDVYKKAFCQCQSLSSEQKESVIKAIIVAAKTDRSLQSITHESAQTREVIQIEDTKTKSSVTIAKALGEGADAVVYQLSTDTVLKVSKQESDSQKRAVSEAETLQVLKDLQTESPDLPGAQNVEEFRQVTNLANGQQALLVKRYEQGDFESHIELQNFAMCIGITDEMLLQADSRADLVEKQLSSHADEASDFIEQVYADKYPVSEERIASDQIEKRAKEIQDEKPNMAHEDCLYKAENELKQKQNDEKKSDRMEALKDAFCQKLKTDYIPLTPEKRVDMARQLISGAVFMSQAGVVHADIKPGNIRWSEEHYVFGDFGTAVKQDTIDQLADRASTFLLEDKRGFTIGKQASAIGEAVRAFSMSSGSNAINDLSDLMARFEKAGVCEKNNGKYEFNSEKMKNLSAILTKGKNNEPLTDKQIKDNKDLLDQAVKAGILEKNGNIYRPALSLTPSLQQEASEFFSFLCSPAKMFVGTNLYSSVQDENWIAFEAQRGNPTGVTASIDSQQTFSVGVMIIESITGWRPARNESGASTTVSQQNEIRQKLIKQGMSEGFCRIIIEMVRDQGIDPFSLLDMCERSGKFDDEEIDKIRQEVKEVRAGRIALEKSETLKNAAVKIGFSESDCVRNPREALSELLTQLETEMGKSI